MPGRCQRITQGRIVQFAVHRLRKPYCESADDLYAGSRDRKQDERTAVWQTATSKEYVERDRKDIGAAGNIPETCGGDRQKAILEVSLIVFLAAYVPRSCDLPH
jgi:hypothetical protein